MPEALNDPLAPDVLDPAAHRPISGDWNDDDGQALDDAFLSMEVGPIDYGQLGEGAPASTPLTTRWLTNRVDGAANVGVPIMMFPADPNRIGLSLFWDTATATASDTCAARFGSGKSESGFGFVIKNGTGIQQISLDGHTGPVWVTVLESVANAFINVVSTTK